MSNIVRSDSKQVKQELINGIKKLSDIVSVTLGPRGKNVVIRRNYENPHATKDGVTVAEEVYLDDEIESIGADVVRQATSKTAREAGDGTTTSTIIASSIIQSLYDSVEDLTGMKEVLDYIKGFIFNKLDEIKIDLKDKPELLKAVSSVSANNDEEIGRLVSEAFQKSPAVHVEISRTNDTYISTTKGASFNRGYLSPFFITDDDEEVCKLPQPLILFYDGLINTSQQIYEIANKCFENQRPFVVIANDIKDDALQTMVQNKVQNNLPIVAVKSPYFGDERVATMKDLCTLTGATFVSDSVGISLDEVDLNMLGQCRSINVTHDSTTIIDGAGDKDEISKRKIGVKKSLDKIENNPGREKTLRRRLAMFEGGVSTIYVGGNTEIEMRQRKDRVDDAVCAARASLEDGVVPGSGLVLHRISKILQSEFMDKDEPHPSSLQIIMSLKQPFKVIAKNSGYDEHETMDILNNIYENEAEGFDFLKRKYCNLVESGIVDPTKVLKSCIQNAFSVAESILTTEGVISVKNENKPEKLGNEINQFNPQQFS